MPSLLTLKESSGIIFDNFDSYHQFLSVAKQTTTEMIDSKGYVSSSVAFDTALWFFGGFVSGGLTLCMFFASLVGGKSSRGFSSV